jgi:hypothetical protein
MAQIFADSAQKSSFNEFQAVRAIDLVNKKRGGILY